MVADALIYHPSVTHYLKFVATTVGRDKFMRTIQYFSRFYAWYLLRLNATPAEIAPFEAAKKQLGMIRKALRLGKFVEHFRAAAQAFDTKAYSNGGGMAPFLRYCAIGRQLGYAGYMLCDNTAFFDASGIYKSEAGKRAQVLGYRSWLTGLTFNAMAGLYQLYVLRMREQGINKKDGEGKVEAGRVARERKAVHLQLLSDVCDMAAPVYALGFDGGRLDDGLVGLAGTVSSVIGVYSVWQKTA